MQTIINLFKMLSVLGQFKPERGDDGLKLIHQPTGCWMLFRDDGSLITHAPFNNVPTAGQSLLLNCQDESINRMSQLQLEIRDEKLAQERATEEQFQVFKAVLDDVMQEVAVADLLRDHARA